MIIITVIEYEVKSAVCAAPALMIESINFLAWIYFYVNI